MFKDIKLLGKESAIYGLSTVIARLLNFFLLPFYTHYLTTGDYGIVAAVFSYIAFLNILYQYGMDQAYMRYSKENEKTFTAAFISLMAPRKNPFQAYTDELFAYSHIVTLQQDQSNPESLLFHPHAR